MAEQGRRVKNTCILVHYEIKIALLSCATPSLFIHCRSKWNWYIILTAAPPICCLSQTAALILITSYNVSHEAGGKICCLHWQRSLLGIRQLKRYLCNYAHTYNSPPLPSTYQYSLLVQKHDQHSKASATFRTLLCHHTIFFKSIFHFKH